MLGNNEQELAYGAQRGTVARGSIAWLSAHIVYIITSFVIHIIVSRTLGPEQYGKFGAVMALASVIYMAVGATIPSSVSRYISSSNAEEGNIFQTGLQVQALLCIGIALGVGVTGGLIARWILADTNLSLPIRIAGLAVLPLGLLCVYERALLGRLDYIRASFLSSLLSLVCLVSVAVAAAVSGHIIGVLGAYVAAPTLVLFGATWMIQFKKPSENTFDWRKMLSFSAPMLIVGLLSSLMLQMSKLFVNALVKPAEMVGIFVAASVIANVPYHMFMGLSSVLMPAVSHAESINDSKLLGKNVRESLRVLLVLSIPFLLWLYLSAEGLITLVYGDRYLDAAIVVVPLAFGATLLAWGRTLLSVIEGIGRPWISVGMCLLSVLLIAACDLLLIPYFGLIGAAYGACLGGLGLFMTSFIYVTRQYSVPFPYRSFGRIVFAVVFAYLAASQVRVRGIYGMAIRTITIGTFYLILLWGLGEFVDLGFLRIAKLLWRSTSCSYIQREREDN